MLQERLILWSRTIHHWQCQCKCRMPDMRGSLNLLSIDPKLHKWQLTVSINPTCPSRISRQPLTTRLPALLVYDYLLTLPQEVELIWCRKPSATMILFLVNRCSIAIVRGFTSIQFVSWGNVPGNHADKVSSILSASGTYGFAHYLPRRCWVDRFKLDLARRF